VDGFKHKLDYKLYTCLKRVYGSLVDVLVEKLYTPPSRFYARVNTLYITREELIDRLERAGFKAKSDPYVDDAVYFEVEGPFKVADLGKHIVVDKKSAESIMFGANLYAPGVKGFDEFEEGEEVTVLAPNGEAIAVVKTVVSSEKLRGMSKGLVGVNVESKYRTPPIRELAEYAEGLLYPQSLPSIMTVHALNPEPGDLVVDLNASPGGKTSHVVQLTRGLARILAFDRSLDKIEELVSTLTRLHLYRNVVALPTDSRYADVDLNLVGRADKVLVDPPCTGLGVRPKVFIDKTYRDVISASNYQYQFLKTASRIAKCNGIIVYSTCTITFEENEYVSLKAVRELKLEPIDLGKLPYAEIVELNDLIAYRYSPLSYNMTGYYIALFRKKC